MTATIAAVLSVASTLAGTGLSYSAQMDAAKQADMLANLNMQFERQTATQNAALQSQAQTMQAAQQHTQAQMQNLQAGAVLARTEAESAQARENIRRANAASEAARARLRATSGAGNVNPDTASPLDLIVAEAERAVTDAMFLRDADELRRRAGALDALGIQAGAVQSSLQAGFLTAAAADSIVQGRLNASRATMNYHNQLAHNEGEGGQALGGLITGIGRAAENIYQFRALS